MPDTDATFLNFDGITYGKGAAVLKQLVAAVGMEAFRDGMRRYFQRHAFGNTTLAEFLDAIDEGVERDLHEWAALWLETPSLNTISADWTAEGGAIASFALDQTAPDDYPTIRPHQLDVALITESNGSLDVAGVPVAVEGERTEGVGGGRDSRARARDAEPRRPRLREGRPRRPLARLRPRPP